MAASYKPEKPAVLTLVTIVSFLWSGLNVLRVMVGTFLALLFGAGSWFLGPVVGAAGSLISMMWIVLLFVSSVLSLLLFAAAWHTLAGEPAGRSLHRTWAIINLVVDGLGLLLTGGLSPAAWWGVVYAISVLYVMDLPEVRAYFDRQSLGSPFKPGGLLDDAL